MSKYKAITPQQAEILERNGVKADNVTVVHADEDCLRVMNFKTRDTITIHRGDKPW